MSTPMNQNYSRDGSPANGYQSGLRRRSNTMAMINLMQPSKSNSIEHNHENEMASFSKEASQKIADNNILSNKKLTVSPKSQLKISKPDDITGFFKLLAENTSSNFTPEHHMPLVKERSLPKPLDLAKKTKNMLGMRADGGISQIKFKSNNQNSVVVNPNMSSDLISGDGESKHQSNKSNKKKTTLLQVAKLFPSVKALEIKEKRDDKALDDSFAERNAVESLEKWTNEYKQALQMRTIEMQKANTLEWTQGKDFDQRERAPEINQAVINLISKSHARTAQQKIEALKKVSQPQEHYRSKAQKNIEQIQTETNRMIINDILFNKISQQIKRQSANVSKNESSEDILTKSQIMSGDTMNNFRALQSQLSVPPSMVIDYKALWKRLNFNAVGPKPLFDYSEYQKKADEERHKFEKQEKDLLKKFQDMLLEIHEKKALQSEIRLLNHERLTKIKVFQDEIEDINRNVLMYEERVKKEKLAQMAPKGRRKGRINLPTAVNVEEVRKMEVIKKMREDSRSKIDSRKEAIDKLNEEINKTLHRIEIIDHEIAGLRLKKAETRLEVKHLYMRMLGDDDLIFESDNSLIYIIKALWKVNEEVSEDMFPRFVDRESLKFLFQYAQLDYELEQIQSFKRSDEYLDFLKKFKDQKEHKISVLHSTMPDLLRKVQERVRELKKGLLKKRKPVFSKDSKLNVERWVDVSTDVVDQVLLNKNLDVLYFYENIDKMLGDITNKINEIKEKQAARVFKMYITKEINEKNLVSLAKLLVLLFGRAHAEKEYMNFIRLRQTYENAAEMNKSYNFALKNSHLPTHSKKQNNMGLLMSYTSTFRSTGNNFHSSFVKSLENNNSAIVANPLPEYNSENEQGVNYKYNLLFKGLPEIQNADETNGYFVSKPISAQSSVKHSLNLTTGVPEEGGTGVGSRAEIPSRGGSSFMKSATSFFNPGSTGGFVSRGSFQMGHTPGISAQGKRSGLNSRQSEKNVRFMIGDNSTTE